MSNKKSRKSNLDLMRFVCMLMVVSLHYFGEGGVNSAESATTFNSMFGSIMVVACRGAVNCFYMNSGYFFKEKRNIEVTRSWQSTLELYKQILFYSILISGVSILLGISEPTNSAFVRAFFPILGNQWWFATVFILISLWRPLLEKVVCDLTDKEFVFLLGVLLYFDSIQAVFGVNVFNEIGNGLLHGITMVMLGYAVRRLDQFRLTQSAALYLYCACVLITRASSLLFRIVPGLQIDYWRQIMVYNSPFIIIIAWSLFCVFQGLKLEDSPISKISDSVFAIYLIQDHSMMRENLWIKVFRCDLFYSSNWMIFHYVCSVLVVAIVGIAVDRIRLCIIRKIGIIRNSQ